MPSRCETTAEYLQHNLSKNLQHICTDSRDNQWYRAALPDDDGLRQYLKEVHSTWATMSDKCIDTCKDQLKILLAEERDVFGMTCHDFLYIFTADAACHYFVSMADPAWLYVYRGECDMHLAQSATMSFIEDMVSMGV